jgi:hypothetical protein
MFSIGIQQTEMVNLIFNRERHWRWVNPPFCSSTVEDEERNETLLGLGDIKNSPLQRIYYYFFTTVSSLTIFFFLSKRQKVCTNSCGLNTSNNERQVMYRVR